MTTYKSRDMGRICGKHAFLPASDKRIAEGGRRLDGKHKSGKKNLPLVSILTCVLNGEKYISKCIKSVLEQTWGNIEYIIIDGGSSDRTLSIINSYVDSIDYFVSERDNGLYDALNKGISLAMGEFILILNSDDWYVNNAVERLVNAIRKYNVAFASGLAAIVDDEDNIIGHIPHYPFNDFVFLRMPLRHELMLIPAYVYNQIGCYDTSFRIISDLDFAQRLKKADFDLYEIHDELMYFRANGISSNIPLLKEERQRLLFKNFPFLTPHDCKILADMTRVDIDLCKYFINKYNSHFKFCKCFDFWLNNG